MSNREDKIIDYINALLNDTNVDSPIPQILTEIAGLHEIDETIRNLRNSIETIGKGDLSDEITGNGHLMGNVKNLQANFKNLIWQTKAVSAGDFSNRVEVLGEFSVAFNNMIKKSESTINEVIESKELFELFFDAIPDPTIIISYDEFKFLMCNNMFEIITGYSEDYLFGKSINDIRFFKDIDQQKQFFRTLKNTKNFETLSLELDLDIGDAFHGLFSSVTIEIENKLYILIVIKDITEIKKLESKLRESEEIHRLLADNASDVIWVMDLSGKYIYISPSIQKLTGFSVAEIMAKSRKELLSPSSLAYFERNLKTTTYQVKNDLPFVDFRGDLEQLCKDGSIIKTDTTVSGIYDKDNKFFGILGVSRDVTERREMEEKIRRLTEVDHLTQLYNRLKLDSVVKIEIERTKRSTSAFTVIMLDIDHFKRVNDTYGHIIGDEVLKEIALIIKKTIRKIDIAGRWGGEEFMIILPESKVYGGLKLANKIRLNIEKHKFSDIGKLTASFGVAEYEINMNEVELVTKVDKAMYDAKEAGRNVVCVYSDNQIK